MDVAAPSTRATSISENLMFSTVRIECELRSGGSSTGTGFFYEFAGDKPGVNVPVIATNNHVTNGAAKGYFHIHVGSGDALQRRHIRFGVEDFSSRWYPHPDPEIDLCISRSRT